MNDKSALIREVFELCNGQRNFRLWLDHRGDQLKEGYTGEDDGGEALKKHFVQLGEQKIPQWLDIVVDVYTTVVTEEELEYAKAELTRIRATGVIDPPDDSLPEALRDTFLKLRLLEVELNRRMHSFLENLLIKAISTYRARN